MYKKQQDEVMEQVLIDLLSRHVISDAEQDRDPNRSHPSDPTNNFNMAPLRNKSRRLHDTKFVVLSTLLLFILDNFIKFIL